jgi:hypothetical protein
MQIGAPEARVHADGRRGCCRAVVYLFSFLRCLRPARFPQEHLRTCRTHVTCGITDRCEFLSCGIRSLGCACKSSPGLVVWVRHTVGACGWVRFAGAFCVTARNGSVTCVPSHSTIAPAQNSPCFCQHNIPSTNFPNRNSSLSSYPQALARSI